MSGSSATPLDAQQALGWDAHREAAARAQGLAPGALARVVAVDRDLLLLADARGTFRGTLAGRLRHGAHGADDLPCVGDWVVVERGAEATGGEALARVIAVLPRRTWLRRRAAGEEGAAQLIAANIDAVFVVMSCHFDFNPARLERYLVMIREGGAAPQVLLTKTDLVAPEQLAAQRAQVEAVAPGVPVLALSNASGDGVAAVASLLQPGRTYCFVGSSGVGKSTLINSLLGRARQATGSTSGTGEGRHVTVRRELVALEGGALVIDNPGMREFGLMAGEAEVAAGFADIEALAARCRFRDCRHVDEPGCGVRAALDAGTLDAAHYRHFLKLREEAAFHDLTQLERRHKDRAFGRMVRTAKKDLDRD